MPAGRMFSTTTADSPALIGVRAKATSAIGGDGEAVSARLR